MTSGTTIEPGGRLLGDDFSGITIRLVGLWLLYRVGLALYNISPFHPLYRFPGPKLAAMSFVYEFWFDAILWGKYTTEIQRLHEIYGPIVRINPEELHCNDPEFVDEIYAGAGRVRDKHQHFLNATAGALVHSSFGTKEHELHRIRRGAVNKAFSRGQIKRLEPEVHELVQQFCDKLLASTNQPPLELNSAYSCFTADVISKYCFGEAMGFVAADGWNKGFKIALESFTQSIYLLRYMPVLRNLAAVAPYIQDYMPEHIGNLFKELTQTMPSHIQKAKENQEQTKGRIFADLLDSNLPESEKTVFRLSGEGFSFTSAGTETSAGALAYITYYLLSKPEIRERLTEELRDVDPKNLDWQDLEGRVYLYGVIQEALRLNYGVSQRLARIARTENLIYQSQDGKYQYIIPKGTPIGASSRLLHHNEEAFPDSHEFRPERWITSDGQRNLPLEKYLITFSKGSRICLGMNLAICEIYLMVAAITLRVLPRMKLYETTYNDIAYDHDLMIPVAKKGTNGIRITMT